MLRILFGQLDKTQRASQQNPIRKCPGREIELMATELRDITGGTSLPGAQDTVTHAIFRDTCVYSPVIHKIWAGTTHISGHSTSGLDLGPAR